MYDPCFITGFVTTLVTVGSFVFRDLGAEGVRTTGLAGCCFARFAGIPFTLGFSTIELLASSSRRFSTFLLPGGLPRGLPAGL